MLRTLVEKRSFGVGALVDLLQHGAPSMVHSHVDAKARLERQLKASCEEYITHCTVRDTRRTPIHPDTPHVLPIPAPRPDGAAPPPRLAGE